MQEVEIGLENINVSLEAELYELFYRQHGIRRPSQIDNPIFSDIGAKTFPRNSIYHYNPESPLLFGPLENNPWYASDKNLRFIDHIFEFKTETIGNPIRKPASSAQYIQAYRRKHRTLKFLRDFFNINRNPNMLIVYNYCILNQLYKYRPHRFVNYYHFKNLYSTIISNINKVANQTDRHQFFEVRMPKVLPARTILRQQSKEYATSGLSNKIVGTFQDDDGFLLLHLWLWLGANRNYSIFNKIEQRNLSKINLLLTDSGKYVLINLGQLNAWMSEDNTDEEVVEMDDSGNVVSSRSESIQLKFYKLLTKLLEYRMGAGNVNTIDVPKYTEADLNDTTPVEDDESEPMGEEKVENNNPNLTPEKVLQATDKLLGTELSDKSKTNNIDAKQAGKSKLNEIPRIDEKGEVVSPAEMNKPAKPVIQDNSIEPPQEEKQPEYVVDDAELDFIPETEPVDNLPDDPYQRGPLKDALQLVKNGTMTVREYNRIERQAEKYKSIPNPFDESGKTTLEDFINSGTKEDTEIKPLTIPDSPWILDKNMLETTVEPLTRQYIKKSLKRDITKSMLSIQKAGMMVTDLSVETVSDAGGKYDNWKLKVQPIGGSESTVNIKMPHIDEEGVMEVSSIRYNLRNQRKDKPIRKVSPNKVSLTSYYNKLSITKADRRTFNLEAFYHTQLNAKVLEGSISNIEYGNIFNPEIKVPTVYAQLATRFKRFILNTGEECIFDYDRRIQLIRDPVKLKQLEEKYNGILFAKDKQGFYFINHEDNLVYGGTLAQPVPLNVFLKIEKEPPLEMVEIKIFSNSIPLVFLLGYYKGMTGLLRDLKIKPRKVFRGQRASLTPNEYAIKFADETWIFDKSNRQASLLLAGLNHYKRYLQDYSANQFDDPETFIALLADTGITAQIENEFKLMERMWVDDITKDLLAQMGEPTTFIPLLYRAVELLTTPYSRAEVNMDDMIIAGYQRIAGQVYKQLVGNVKTMMNNRSIQARKRFDMPPTHILQTIMKDPSVTLVDDINPIHNLKEHENITFGGDGGRSRRSMVSHTRSYNKSDLGVISEATVDSADVAVTTFLSANPSLTTTLGTSERIDTKNTSAAKVLSTTSNLYVAAIRDDSKRALFTSIQNSHTVAINGSFPQPVRTGYDTVLAHRVDKKFACVAKEEGKVTEVSNNHIAIEYKDGSTDRFKIGLQYGVSTGNVINNMLITDYTVGQKVKAGDVVAFHPSHFQRDIFDPTQVLFKNSALAFTALMESNDTEEDSSAISTRLASAMEMGVTEVRTIVVNFEDNIRNLVQVGDAVETDTPLCTIVNAVFSENSMFRSDDDDLDTLKQLANVSPRSKHHGLVTKIEVVYLGDPVDATDSVKAVINKSDKERRLLAERLKTDIPTTGKLNEAIRVDGTLLGTGQLAIKFYIEHIDGMSIGDKLVVIL